MVLSFLRTYSRFFGSFTTTPDGRKGIEMAKVSDPNFL